MTETLTIPHDHCPVDLLLFRRFQQEVPGLVEATLAQNRFLAAYGPFPPQGTQVTVTPPVPSGAQPPKTVVRLYS
jgi:phage tail protein X